MSELKPCPFCGSPAYSYHDNCIDFAGVKCDLGGCVCADILITENNWNTRPIEDALTARIAELEAHIAALEADYVISNRELLIKQVEINRQSARIAELEAERRWIPVGERLPEEKQSVLALDRTGTAYHWEYSKCLSNIFVGYYTHWMPLPEPPEVK